MAGIEKTTEPARRHGSFPPFPAGFPGGAPPPLGPGFSDAGNPGDLHHATNCFVPSCQRGDIAPMCMLRWHIWENSVRKAQKDANFASFPQLDLRFMQSYKLQNFIAISPITGMAVDVAERASSRSRRADLRGGRKRQESRPLPNTELVQKISFLQIVISPPPHRTMALLRPLPSSGRTGRPARLPAWGAAATWNERLAVILHIFMFFERCW